MKPVFYHYWRSSSSWRVRWALVHKGVDHEAVAVDLLAGQQKEEAHTRRNPLGMVPVLQVGDVFLAESVAIIEYLEERYPEPRLLPADLLLRARARQLVEIINAGTQPLQNLSVLRKVSEDGEAQKAWAQHFIRRGLDAFEAVLAAAPPAGPHAVGAALSIADLFLVPQCYNARRYGLSVEDWPRIAAVEAAALSTEAAQRTAPQHQAHPATA